MNKDLFVKQYSTHRKGSTSLKWDLLEERYGDADLIPMWVADMEFKTCDSIIEAMKARVEHGIFGYSYVPQSYYDAYFNWMETRHGYRPQKEWVRLATGIVAALYWFVNCYTKPEDGVLILTPVYYPFHNAVKDCGRTLITCDLANDNGYFTVDYDAFEKAIVEGNAKMFILCSPHNPVGRVWKEEELDRMLDICKRHGVLVISDEIHQDFVFGEHKHIPAPLVSGGKYCDNLILVNAASKTFNLAALIHSNIIISDPALRAQYDAYEKMYNRTDFNTMGLTATQAGYEGGADWLSGLLAVIEDNYNYVKTELNQHFPEIIVSPLEGTYLPLLDMRAWMAPEKLKDFIQGRCRLAVDYGEWFGENFKGFIRLNLATDPQYVKAAIHAIIREYEYI